MPLQNLDPDLDLLREEYVLVQAWKKTSNHLRQHNWYADTIELDLASADLQSFLNELRRRLEAPNAWVPKPLRLVPAPKSQSWTLDEGRWTPAQSTKPASRLRPLAHVDIRDQVIATALALCMANRVETAQGDPRVSIAAEQDRRRVISYGNRLFCQEDGNELHHRWGSSTLYRRFFQDYRRFLNRPQAVAKSIDPRPGQRILIVNSDLSNFYDRVTSGLLYSKLSALMRPYDDSRFLDLAGRVLDWQWHAQDADQVARYADGAGISDFNNIALPQGLATAGFFANVTLLDFDDALRTSIGEEIEPGVKLEDACRYVDDLRFVITIDDQHSPEDVKLMTHRWVQELLTGTAQGLQASEEKTISTVFGTDGRPPVLQSSKMERIQHAVSGGFDPVQAEEILASVQALVRSQQRFSPLGPEEETWRMSPVPDVGDATVARFAAQRFRTTFRSLRPLLDDHSPSNTGGTDILGVEPLRTRADLDADARSFALGLVENWILDPSNVRLLRIGLDIWPDPQLLDSVLELLRPYTSERTASEADFVAWYCLAEVFRAGAIETGLVSDEEVLPTDVDLDKYRSVLWDEAERLLSLPKPRVPWYVRQQILLYAAAFNSADAPLDGDRTPESRRYRDLIRYLRGDGARWKERKFAAYSVLARKSFLEPDRAVQLVARRLNLRLLNMIGEMDPSFAAEIINAGTNFETPRRLRRDLGLEESPGTLHALVLGDSRNEALRSERSVLRFAEKFLRIAPRRVDDVITPSDVFIELVDGETEDATDVEVADLRIMPLQTQDAKSIYRPPAWCDPTERWRFQLGYLVRFILNAQPDFTRTTRFPGRPRLEREHYRTPESNWYQRLYGMFSAHSAFGDDWLPVSDWLEQLLFELLLWPGCEPSDLDFVRQGRRATLKAIQSRLRELKRLQGPAHSVFILPLKARRPRRTTEDRKLRACVVQTILPRMQDFQADPSVSQPAARREQRRHLSSILAAVDKMLAVRGTHMPDGSRLDWLILPELSVHPDDARTHLQRFALKHRTIVLAGLTYQSQGPKKPFVNMGVWIIPEWSSSRGLQLRWRYQGKQYPAQEEHGLGVQGYRPCQWIVGYPWANGERELHLTASICYDATDLNLAADLRGKSDVYAIPALNRDVNTFDQMALALQYHMFQMVIVANNGTYGGSNAHVPYREQYERQIFHLHGQPQASIGFVEIDDIGVFRARKTSGLKGRSSPRARKAFKYPPAGL